MQDDKWQAVVGKIKDEFDVLDHQTQELDPGPGSVEYLVFEGPAGRIKVERTTRPLVTGTRGIGSRRIGSQAHVQYEYSATEQTHAFKAYRWEERTGTWQELEKKEDSFRL